MLEGNAGISIEMQIFISRRLNQNRKIIIMTFQKIKVNCLSMKENKMLEGKAGTSYKNTNIYFT